MKVTLGQINTTPNDFDGNYLQIKYGIKQAISDGADLIVFPELSIPGYLIQDLIYGHDFVNKNYEYLNKICDLTKGNKKLYVVVGYVEKNNNGCGKPFYNSVAVINNGFIIGRYNKWLLPFYDVFDESRWFEPGKDLLIFNIDNKRCGVACCEDFWNCKGQDDYNHKMNPIQKYRELGVDVMISLNASPFVEGKPRQRLKMLEEVCKDSFDLIYVNQYGGQDQLVFDGHSFVMNKKGIVNGYIVNQLIPDKKDFTKGAAGAYKTFDTEKFNFIDKNENDEVLKMILLGLYDYGTKSGFKKFVLGSSGGIDSAVVAALAAMAFGGENVYGIRMPSRWNDAGSKDDAYVLHQNFGINDRVKPIDYEPWLNSINKDLGLDDRDFDPETMTRPVGYNAVADENIQARMRGQVVMHYSNAMGALALGTTNHTEQAVGYGTLFGDLASTINVIGDLYKMQVFGIAKRINEIYRKEMIPVAIINKPPSAQLAPNQTDEKALMPYAILDNVCRAYVENYIANLDDFLKSEFGVVVENNEEYIKILNERYDSMIKRIDAMEFKRRLAAFCIKVTKKAFGPGRRIPICKGRG